METGEQKALLREEFDRWADAGRGEGMREGHWDMTIQTIERMNLNGTERILDLGCGNGWAVRELAEYLPEGMAAGIDISGKMIREAMIRSQQFHNVEFQVSSADQLPFGDDTYHHLLSVESFYYYPELEPVLREIRRVLKPGGYFWCLVDLYKENEYSMAWPDQLDVPVHALSEQEYRDLFESQGLQVILQTRIVDRRPITEENFSPGWGTETFEEYQEYKAMGSLLTVGNNI